MKHVPAMIAFRVAWRIFRPVLIRALAREENDGDSDDGWIWQAIINIGDLLANRPQAKTENDDDHI